jgi:hypothetical protein
MRKLLVLVTDRRSRRPDRQNSRCSGSRQLSAFGPGARPLNSDFGLIQLPEAPITGSEKAVRRDPIGVL